MQTESSRNRFRGWRESKRLVETCKSTPVDLKDMTSQANANDVSYEVLQSFVSLLTEDQVSLIQRVRLQMRLRIKNQRFIP